jgi:integrase/recombinase XerD
MVKVDREPASSIQWSEKKLKLLQAQLTDKWAEDTWTLTTQNKKGKTDQRLLHFTLTSPPLNIEFKYALWYGFNQGIWEKPSGVYRLFYSLQDLMRWLNQAAPATLSLMEKSLEVWVFSLRTYLVEADKYRPGKQKRLYASQTYATNTFEDRRISHFRVLYHIIADAYDDQPEMEKEIWDLRKLNLPLNLSQSSFYLNFTLISQPWLRALAKTYMKYNIAIYSAGDCKSKLTVINCFSRFLAVSAPQAQAKDIDQMVILNFSRFLQEQHFSARGRLQYLIRLRTVFETCAHRLHVPDLTRERLIFDEDLPQLPESDSREIPEEVLVQLREHLDTLPTTLLRMITVLLEVGLRINELCQLPVDCLICDDKHEWYLRFYQSKSHKDHVIPLVEERVIGTIQAQQREIREKWGNTCLYLFPSVCSHLQPFKQATFRESLNRWAVKHEIKDLNQQLYRFTTHQFRHTVAMNLINDDVPIEVISRLLGHKSLLMTQVYARVRDKKLRADLERVARKRKTVDYQGNAVKGDSRANDPEVQMTRKGVRGQTLPVGGCGRLVVLGECSHANKCLTCPMWLTSTDDLPRLKSFYERAIHLKQRATEVGNQVVIDQQTRIVTTLAVRIKSLETTEMDGTLCVDDVLSSLRTDLVEAESGLEEAREARLVLAAKHLERTITEIKARIAALEEPV